MKELAIVPVKTGFEDILDNPLYLEADPDDYNIAGYLYFYRLSDNGQLICKRVPYTFYYSSRCKLTISLWPSYMNPPLVICIYKDLMHKAGVYYRSSYRNYSYENNRVRY